MRPCVILAGGDMPPAVLPEGAFVIAADSGYAHAQRLGIVPDVLLGDFDSYTAPLPDGIPIVRHPVEKDDTDTALAVQYGRELGYTDFWIYGVFGGERADHSVANLFLLRWMAEEGLHGTLVHGGTTMQVLRPGTIVLPQYRGTLSLFSVTDVCRGLTLRGTKYETDGIVLKSGLTLGAGNEITAPEATITFTEGLLLVVQVRL